MLLLEANLPVDPIDPQVYVVGARQINGLGMSWRRPATRSIGVHQRDDRPDQACEGYTEINGC